MPELTLGNGPHRATRFPVSPRRGISSRCVVSRSAAARAATRHTSDMSQSSRNRPGCRRRKPRGRGGGRSPRPLPSSGAAAAEGPCGAERLPRGAPRPDPRPARSGSSLIGRPGSTPASVATTRPPIVARSYPPSSPGPRQPGRPEPAALAGVPVGVTSSGLSGSPARHRPRARPPTPRPPSRWPRRPATPPPPTRARPPSRCSGRLRVAPSRRPRRLVGKPIQCGTQP